MRNIMNFLKITAVTLTMLFSGTSYGSLTQWDVTSSAGSGYWKFSGYVQGDVDPFSDGAFVVPITDYRFEFTGIMGHTAVFVVGGTDFGISDLIISTDRGLSVVDSVGIGFVGWPDSYFHRTSCYLVDSGTRFECQDT
jgi:hypothetical protein